MDNGRLRKEMDKRNGQKKWTELYGQGEWTKEMDTLDKNLLLSKLKTTKLGRISIRRLESIY